MTVDSEDTGVGTGEELDWEVELEEDTDWEVELEEDTGVDSRAAMVVEMLAAMVAEMGVFVFF